MGGDEFEQVIYDFGHRLDNCLFENVLTSSVGGNFKIHRTDKVQNNNRYAGMVGDYGHAT